MAKVQLVAIHHIVRTKDEILPGKSFTEDEKEAEYLINTGAARAVEEDAEAPVKPKKSAKAAAAAEPAAAPEPELDDETEI